MTDGQQPGWPDQPWQSHQPSSRQTGWQQGQGWAPQKLPQPSTSQMPPQASVPQPGAPWPPGNTQPGAPVPVPAKGGKGRLVVGIAAVVVVCGGLWGVGKLINTIADKDDWKGLGQPVALPAVQPLPTPTWKRPNLFGPDAKADPEIRYELESWVLQSAGVQRPVGSMCDDKGFTGDSAATFDCTVTFEGQNVVYTVNATPKGNHVFAWTATTARTVVTREGILQLLAGQYLQTDGWSNLRCDALPEVALAPVGQALPQVCYVKPKDAKTQKILIKPSDRDPPSLQTQNQD